MRIQPSTIIKNLIVKNLKALVRKCSISMFFGTTLIATSFLSFGQQANIWYFHQKAGLDFNTSPPTVLTNGAIVTPTITPGMEGEGVASIADNTGALLFYTDGTVVYNKNHVAMGNGTGLMGHQSSAQSAIIIPKPGSSTNYYLITAPLTNATTGVRYSEINMTLNAGLGDIIGGQKNILLSSAIRMMEAIAAVPHSNGTDYWLITHQGAGTNTFNLHLITSAGIGAASSTNIGYSIPGGGSDIGLIKSNSCYTKLAIAFHSSDIVDLLNFNNASGTLSAPISLTNFTTGDGAYGLEFSPNGTYLYVTGLYNKILYQFDISLAGAAAINASRFTVGLAQAGADRLAALQLGPDGKIYAANHSWGPYNTSTFTYIGTIGSPNNAGAGCNWVNNAIAIPSVEGPIGVFSGVKHGLPTFLKSFITSSTAIQASSSCLGQATTFSYTFSGIVSGAVTWDFGDGTATSNTNSPSHTYASTGTYIVTLTFNDNCGNPQTKTKNITIQDRKPSVSWSCSGSNITLTGTNPGTGNSGYLWYGGAGYNTLLSTINTASYTGSPSSFKVYGTTGIAVTSYSTVSTSFPQPGSDYVDFNANSTFLLQSVKVRTENGGGGCNVSPTNVTFTLKQGATIISSRSANLTCGGGSQTVNLDMTVPAGTGYRLESSVRLFFVSSANVGTYPWRPIPAVTYIGTGQGIGGPFADWQIIEPSACSEIIVNVDCALPVELTYFKAVKENLSSLLTWNTASEKNNKNFLVQRSSDGINFETIGTVAGQENSNSSVNYIFYDYAPLNGTNYYRLEQVDFDGQASYTNIVSLNFEQKFLVNIFPNPSQGLFEVRTNNALEAKFIVYNTVGQALFSELKAMDQLSFFLDLSSVSDGVYYLSLQNNTEQHTYKLIKK